MGNQSHHFRRFGSYNMTDDYLWYNLINYEQNHINRYRKEENKKLIACNAITLGEEENIEEDNNKGKALINFGVS